MPKMTICSTQKTIEPATNARCAQASCGILVLKTGASSVKAGCTVKDEHHLSIYSMGCMPLRAILETIVCILKSLPALASLSAS